MTEHHGVRKALTYCFYWPEFIRKTEGDFMFNIGDVLWQLFYPALLVLLFVMVVKEVRFFIKLMPKMNNLDNKRDELHERLKKKDE
jgi:Tfp pilus assembly protein PilO